MTLPVTVIKLLERNLTDAGVLSGFILQNLLFTKAEARRIEQSMRAGDAACRDPVAKFGDQNVACVNNPLKFRWRTGIYGACIRNAGGVFGIDSQEQKLRTPAGGAPESRGRNLTAKADEDNGSRVAGLIPIEALMAVLSQSLGSAISGTGSTVENMSSSAEWEKGNFQNVRIAR